MGVRRRGGIVIVVAHRSKRARQRRPVLVLAEGRVQAFGPKDEVLQKVLRPAAVPARMAAGHMTSASMASSYRTSGRARSIRRHFGAGIDRGALCLCLGVGGWAATTELSGAVIAHGTVVVDSEVKRVQHPTGGVVGELHVREGDRVAAGDVLVRLDQTQTRANFEIISKSLDELVARQARLEAERDGRRERRASRRICSHGSSEEGVAQLIAGEAAALRDAA